MREYRGSIGNGGTTGHVGALTPAMAPLLPVWEYVEYNMIGEGGAVPDRLHPGDGFPFLWKSLRPGP